MTSFAAPEVDFVLEHGADPALLGIQPSTTAGLQRLGRCLAVLGANAPRPQEVKLVITADFVKSVSDRLPPAQRGLYDISRGAGTVGAKTMMVRDDVHVLVPALLCLDADVAQARSAPKHAKEIADIVQLRTGMLYRLVTHEAQHVAMYQNGEDDPIIRDAREGRRNLLVAAHQVMTEYRAELGVPAQMNAPTSEWSPIEDLEVLRDGLRRVACVEYQSHLNVGKLAHDVLYQASNLWKAFAYQAAMCRVEGVAIGEPVSLDVLKTDEWKRMADAHWVDFQEALSDAPTGTTEWDERAREDLTDEVANVLDQWLDTLGFSWSDGPAGSRFDILSWDLLDDDDDDDDDE
ncbi:hypothetical protein PU630_07255 [Microbacterium horticulturae]|uniref:Uncharacterized protein n=1 Tax=Microbacterium horticulturae TaxID=3028316 RepID=A0ABY8C6V5_9MICO|nr:hypothetical protein [Microbacterium sp. KACC 23027]WEG10338.1 hypothetical protein PU630_07255 [Microbacterium sp. KACC 23027]